MEANVQIFGTNKSQDTKKALRFFKERGIKPHFVDLNKRSMSPGELERFVQRFGLASLVDRSGKAYRRLGLEHMRVSDEQLKAKLIEDPGLMVQPLVRSQEALGKGWDESYWRQWFERLKG